MFLIALSVSGVRWATSQRHDIKASLIAHCSPLRFDCKTSITTYRLRISFTCRFLFNLLDLLPKVLNIYTFIVFWNSSELVMESSVLNYPEGQMVCWRHKPDISGVRRISEHIQQDC